MIDIADGIPTDYCIHTNAHALARYAKICQEGGLVPIVEPEVLMDGSHDIARCEEVTDAMLPLMAPNSTIAVCGVMADYETPPEERIGVKNLYHVLMKALTVRGFLAERTGRPPGPQLDELRGMFARGAVRDRSHVVHGLDRAPEHLGLLFTGRNEGKLIVEL